MAQLNRYLKIQKMAETKNVVEMLGEFSTMNRIKFLMDFENEALRRVKVFQKNWQRILLAFLLFILIELGLSITRFFFESHIDGYILVSFVFFLSVLIMAEFILPIGKIPKTKKTLKGLIEEKRKAYPKRIAKLSKELIILESNISKQTKHVNKIEFKKSQLAELEEKNLFIQSYEI